MDEQLKTLLNRINFSQDKYSSFETAVLEIIKGNKEKDNYTFFIALPESLNVDVYREFTEKLPLAFPTIKKVSARFKVSTINQDDVKSYYHYFMNLYISENPLLEMFENNTITVDNNEIKIEVGNLAEKMKLSSITARLLEDLERAGLKNLKFVIDIMILVKK